MKNYSALVMLALASMGCAEKHETSLALLDSKNQQWTTFEGKMLSPDGDVMEVELSLQEASPGVPSSYRLKSMMITNTHSWVDGSEGKYEVTPLGHSQFGITLLEATTAHHIQTGAFFKRNIDRMRKVPSAPPPLNTTDFYFITKGDGLLASTNDDFNRISGDERYTLHQRSELFTVEGYVTIDPDCTMEFFERNTYENWNVAQLGLYTAIEEKYVGLSTEPWEGIYVRALAYSVTDSMDTTGLRSNLVVKKLIAMGDGQ
ncbi:MAG: hypothetical protein QM762_08885 [Chryseolinea sp.]